MNLTACPEFRRRWRRAATLAAALVLLPFGVAAQALHAVPVAEHVWFVQGVSALGSPANRNFISNAGFVVTDDGVVVVDALGSPTLATELLAEIRRVTPQPVRHVILTHYHADHVYGLQALKAAGATVWAHPAAREYLNSDGAQRRLEASRSELAPWIDAQTRLVAPDRWLDGDEQVLMLGGTEIRLRHLGPAHTPEDLAVFVPAAGVLFVGDLVFRGRVPFVGQADSRRWIASLDRLIAFRPRLVLPGHGPVSESPLADLELTRDYLRYLRRTMGAAAKAMEPFDEAYAKTDWSRFEALPLFRAANRMNAYNTYLLMEQQGEP
jgi:glyoxylase-like metal-dependent hydrolase (beta-lactamase superfamily II)